MTMKELSQLYWLNREIEMEQRRLNELTAASTEGCAKITGIPYTRLLTDKTAIAGEIADCRSIIDAKIQQCMAEYNRLYRFISAVDDSQMRMILTLRHVNGLNWRQIAFHIGGGNTEDGVKMAYFRFLKKSEEEK